MPELPEVETTARFLHGRIAGAEITAVTVRWDKTIATHNRGEFERLLVGRKISAVGRRGKFVVFELSPGPERLYAHMRMSGSFDVLSNSIPAETHDRILITLSSGGVLRFHDPRKFGRFYLATQADGVVSSLGVEPLSAAFTKAALSELLNGQRARVKPFLLRQDKIAGLGNIYVDEALWYAKVHPLREAGSLSKEECELLFKGIQKILREAIEAAGTDFGDGVVYGGGYTPKVYGRDGEVCRRCNKVVQRLVVGQRGTHVCPTCQKAPRKKVLSPKKKR